MVDLSKNNESSENGELMQRKKEAEHVCWEEAFCSKKRKGKV